MQKAHCFRSVNNLKSGFENIFLLLLGIREGLNEVELRCPGNVKNRDVTKVSTSQSKDIISLKIYVFLKRCSIPRGLTWWHGRQDTYFM